MGDLHGSSPTHWLAAFVAAGVVVSFAYHLRALTKSGAVAAIIVGGLIVATAGWWLGVVLVTFFATSSALSMYSSRHSDAGEQVRGKRRDAVQVLANGAIPTLCAVASLVVNDSGPWLVASASAIAGAASDTWATEIGRFSQSPPRIITSGKVAPPGTSGAISTVGTLGSLAGSLLIALVAASGTFPGWTIPGISTWTLVGIVTVAGLGGSIIDSGLGATVQAEYRCPSCNQATERSTHGCGTPATLTRGPRWMNNDMVNLVAILGSACAGFALHLIWPPLG
ncbi:MAG: DUF92 domain-containing protein [Chloroflexota bacterium]|nr:DUF92 domain-containing protein [Chloroflexota bacterium]